MLVERSAKDGALFNHKRIVEMSIYLFVRSLKLFSKYDIMFIKLRKEQSANEDY